MKLKDLPVEDLGAFAETVASLSADDVVKLLEEALELFKPSPVAFLEPDAVTVFHGDLHGDIVDLYDCWEKLGKKDVLDSFKLVFLGDYVDRGPKQVEALLLVLALKARRPEEVVVLRGNHEPPKGLEPLPHDFPQHLKLRYGPEGKKVYEVARKVFDKLSYSLVVENSVVAFHGGPSTLLLRRGCAGVQCLYADEPTVVEELLWNEPANICSWDDPPEVCWAPSPRLRGNLWGPGATRSLLAATKTMYLVRADTPVDGVASFHNGKGITVFTRKGAPFANKRAGVWAPDFLASKWYEDPKRWSVVC